MLTKPYGRVAPAADVSVTVAVQFKGWLVKTGFELHDIVVVVGCRAVTVMLVVPLLPL